MATLPLVNGLRFFKAKVSLQIPDSQSTFLAQPDNIRTGSNGIDDPERLVHHDKRLLNDYFPKWEYFRIKHIYGKRKHIHRIVIEL